MTAATANNATNDNSARGATRTPSVEHINGSLQIGQLVNHIVQKDSDTAQGNLAGTRTWARRIEGGGQIVETCPPVCTDTHINDDHGALDDLQHGSSLPGIEVAVSDWQGGTVPVSILAPRIAVDPYNEDPTRQVPHILLEVAEDQFTIPLDSDQFAAVIAQVRAHCDQLEAEVLPKLREAIGDHAVAGIKADESRR